jgi:hypothetical protein
MCALPGVFGGFRSGAQRRGRNRRPVPRGISTGKQGICEHYRINVPYAAFDEGRAGSPVGRRTFELSGRRRARGRRRAAVARRRGRVRCERRPIRARRARPRGRTARACRGEAREGLRPSAVWGGSFIRTEGRSARERFRVGAPVVCWPEFCSGHQQRRGVPTAGVGVIKDRFSDGRRTPFAIND